MPRRGAGSGDAGTRGGVCITMGRRSDGGGEFMATPGSTGGGGGGGEPTKVFEVMRGMNLQL